MRGSPTIRKWTKASRLAALALLVAACELQQIATAEPEDILVAEIVLRSGQATQLGILQRTTAPPGALPVPDATIRVTDELGRVMHFQPVPIQRCVVERASDEVRHGAACYAAEGEDVPPVMPGGVYTLRIETRDGHVLTGVTTLPQPFDLVRPASTTCRLAPGTPLTMTWSAAAGAWAYLAEAHFVGLRAALAPRGLDVPEEPLRLAGVSVSGRDTSIVFPGGFGVFNRFDESIAPVLVALQAGMPENVTTVITIGAADRNLVNWVRGGNFNPSGPVRVSSIVGDGVGVFGSLTLRRATVRTEPGLPLPGC